MSEHLTQFVIDAGHPWPGLMPFTEEAQAFFHGRDLEAVELLRLIKRETLTVLFGQSGLGKSSLLNAGLFPRLRAEDYVPIYIRLDVSEQAPPLAAQVKDAIRINCRTHRIDAPEPPDDATLWGWFHHRDTDFWSARNQLLTPVLVFDQFEEIFTLGRHGENLESRCRAFLEELADLVEDRMPASLAASIEIDPALADGLDYGKHAWKVVFSFREDYLPEFEGLRSLIRPIMQNRMRLTRMSGEQASQSIRKAGGHLVREEVAAQIVRFVAAPRSGRESADLARLEVEPALMSVVCRELNNRRILAGAGEISANLLSAGAQQEIIHDYYENCLTDIDIRVRVFVEDRLLTDAGYRDSCALEDALLLPGVTREAIDILIGRRLFRLEERSGVLRVELTHDVLTRVAKESRDNRKEAERQRLQREAEATRRRRTRRLALLVGSSLAVAIGLAVVFAILLGQANEQRAQLLKTQSSVMLSRANSALEQGVPGEPYAMLAEAIRLNRENRSAVARAVSLFEQRRQPLHVGAVRLGALVELGWLADGGYLVAGGETVRVAAGGRNVETLRLQASGNDHEDAGLLELNAEPRARLAGLSARPAGQTLPVLIGSGLAQHVSRNFMLHLFDAATRKPVARPIQLGGIPVGMAISPKRQWIAAVSGDGRLTLARLDGSAIRHLVLGIEINPEENPLDFVSDDGAAFVHGRDSGLLVRAAGEPVRIADVQGRVRLSPASARMAVPRRREVQLFDLVSGQAVGAPMRHAATVRDIAFSPDGKYLATASLDKQARVWDAATQAMAAPGMRHDGAVLAVRYGDDSRVLFTASADGAARVWQPLRGELLAEPMLHGEAVIEIVPQPGGEQLLVLTAGNEMNLWRWRHPGQPQSLTLPANGRITALAADPAGRYLAWGSSEGEAALMLAGGKPGAGWRLAASGAASTAAAPVGALAFSPDGHWLAVARGGEVSLIDAASGRASAALAAQESPVTALHFSHNGRLLATATSDRTVRLWNTANGQELGLRSQHRQAVQGMAFSPDDSLLLLTERERMVVWDVASGLHRGELKTAGGADQRLLLADFGGKDSIVLAFGGRVQRLLLETGRSGELRLPARLEGKSLALGDLRAWTASLSPDSRQLALGGLDGRLRLVDLASLSFVGEPMRHDDAVLGLAWSPDGQVVMSWSRDRTARVWGIESGYIVADVIMLENEPSLVQAAQGLLATVVADKGVLQPLGRVPVGNVPDWLPTLLEQTGGVRLEKGAVVRLENRSGFDFRKSLNDDAASGWPAWAGTVMEKLRGPAPVGQGEAK
jgi:WD40 repeat protein